MRFTPLLVVFSVLSLGFASPAHAITNGTPDGNDHPAVGALIAEKPYGDGTSAYCTGTLISPTVFLTAAHCGRPQQQTVKVSFAERYQQGATTYTGRFIADSRYAPKKDGHDIAVVVFSSPIPGIKPVKLPSAGLLSRLEDDGSLRNTKFTPVGYGSLNPVKGSHSREAKFVYTDKRSRTSISYGSLTHVWLKLSVNPGDGSTCFGDSGGPNFLGNSDLLVATTVSGDDNYCKTTNYDYRLDSAPAREFLAKFVALP